jgi:hypothetical protein
MNRIKREKKSSLRPFFGCVGVATVLLMMGLTSCEKDVVNGAIRLNFTISDLSYGSEETRSAGRMQMEPETVVVPVHDELHLYATLEEEVDAPLRATEPLEVGTRLRIVAYDSSAHLVDNFEYEVTNSSGAIKPVGSATGLTLPSPGSYTFVVYSLNTAAALSYSATLGPYSPNTAGDDLLYVKVEDVAIVVGDNNVPIVMKHAFSRVTLKATTDNLSGTPDINDLEAALAGYEAMLHDGMIVNGAAEYQAFASFSPLGTTTVTGARRMVYTGGESITSIKITSVTIGTTTRANLLPIQFNQKLDPGKSYTLRISFKNLVWAKSNIYWVKTGTYDDDEDSVADGDVGYLTFDTTDEGNQGYQGVFFKYGSLVGISPTLTTSIHDTPQDISVDTPVYLPTYHAGSPATSTWRSPTISPYTKAGWEPPQSGVASNGAATIPYLDGSYDDTENTRNSTFAMDAARNTKEMYEGMRGDICQYLSKTGAVSGNYRLPMSSEFGTTNSVWNSSNPTTVAVAGGWTKGLINASWNTYDVPQNDAGKPDGIADLTDALENNANKILGFVKNTAMDVILPASGSRSSTGVLDVVGTAGFYWTGSIRGIDGRNSRMMYFTQGMIYLEMSQFRSHGYAVRCLKI